MRKKIIWGIALILGSNIYASIIALSIHFQWSSWVGALNGFIWGFVIAISVIHLSREKPKEE